MLPLTRVEHATNLISLDPDLTQICSAKAILHWTDIAKRGKIGPFQGDAILPAQSTTACPLSTASPGYDLSHLQGIPISLVWGSRDYLIDVEPLLATLSTCDTTRRSEQSTDVNLVARGRGEEEVDLTTTAANNTKGVEEEEENEEGGSVVVCDDHLSSHWRRSTHLSTDRDTELGSSGSESGYLSTSPDTGPPSPSPSPPSKTKTNTDNTNTNTTTTHLLTSNVKLAVCIEGYEHMDFLWATDATHTVWPRLVQVWRDLDKDHMTRTPTPAPTPTPSPLSSSSRE
jgi:hypothetical protein